MQKIPPSRKVRQQLGELVNHGLESESDPVSRMLQLAAQLVVQENSAAWPTKCATSSTRCPDYARSEVKAEAEAAHYAPNQAVANVVADNVLQKYQKLYPSAMKSFYEDWEACVAYLRCPPAHHRRIRTTNLLERAFLEERRRSKVVPRFFTEKSCLKLAFASLWRASQRWRRITMTDVERQGLKRLRRELNLPDHEPSDPPADRRKLIA